MLGAIWVQFSVILVHFEMLTWESWVIVKFAVSWKLPIVERNRWKKYRVLFMSDSLRSFWGHAVHAAKFLMWKYSRVLFPHFTFNFNQKFMINMLAMGECSLSCFWRSVKLKFLWQFKTFVNTRPYGAGNFKMLLWLCFSSALSQT